VSIRSKADDKGGSRLKISGGFAVKTSVPKDEVDTCFSGGGGGGGLAVVRWRWVKIFRVYTRLLSQMELRGIPITLGSDESEEGGCCGREILEVLTILQSLCSCGSYDKPKRIKGGVKERK